MLTLDRAEFKKNLTKYLDRMFYLGGIISPLIASPQAYKIFVSKSATGVAIETWSLYFLGAVCMLIYGLVHNQKPLIFMNTTVLPIYFLIIMGIILYG